MFALGQRIACASWFVFACIRFLSSRFALALLAGESRSAVNDGSYTRAPGPGLGSRWRRAGVMQPCPSASLLVAGGTLDRGVVRSGESRALVRLADRSSASRFLSAACFDGDRGQIAASSPTASLDGALVARSEAEVIAHPQNAPSIMPASARRALIPAHVRKVAPLGSTSYFGYFAGSHAINQRQRPATLLTEGSQIVSRRWLGLYSVPLLLSK